MWGGIQPCLNAHWFSPEGKGWARKAVAGEEGRLRYWHRHTLKETLRGVMQHNHPTNHLTLKSIIILSCQAMTLLWMLLALGSQPTMTDLQAH